MSLSKRKFLRDLTLGVVSGTCLTDALQAGAASPEQALPSLLRHASPDAKPPHNDWVRDTLIEMQGIRVGMTRSDLLKVFTTEGGTSTGLRRTYVYRDCPFFKVDVEFTPVGRPERDNEGRVTLEEDGRDRIAKISKPYLGWMILD